MKRLNKRKYILAFLLIIQCSFLLFSKFVIFKSDIQIASGNLYFLSLLLISLLPYIFFYLSMPVTKAPVNVNEKKMNFQSVLNIEGNSKENTKLEISFEGFNDIFNTEDNLKTAFEKLFTALSKKIELAQGLAFVRTNDTFEMKSGYAYPYGEIARSFAIGEGISGEVAQTLKFINIADIPENYITIVSGLGSSSPRQILIYPLVSDNKCVGIIEIALFIEVSNEISDSLNELFTPLGEHVYKNLNK